MCLLRLQLITAFRRFLMRRKRRRTEGRRGEERRGGLNEKLISAYNGHDGEPQREGGRVDAGRRPTERMWAYLLSGLHTRSLAQSPSTDDAQRSSEIRTDADGLARPNSESSLVQSVLGPLQTPKARAGCTAGLDAGRTEVRKRRMRGTFTPHLSRRHCRHVRQRWHHAAPFERARAGRGS